MTRHIVFHGHHNCDSPVEFLDGSFQNRKEDIRVNKDRDEHAIRFALFKNITHLLPVTIRAKLNKTCGLEIPIKIFEIDDHEFLHWKEHER